MVGVWSAAVYRGAREWNSGASVFVIDIAAAMVAMRRGDFRAQGAMTRINGIPPQELTGPHLVAEYRELPRIFALVRAAAARGARPEDPRNPLE